MNIPSSIPPFHRHSEEETLRVVESSQPGVSGTSVAPLLRRAQSLPTRVDFQRDEVLEFVRAGEGSPMVPALRKATTDPARAYPDHPARFPYELKPGLQVEYPQNVSSKSLIKQWIAESPVCPFMQKIAEIMARDDCMLKRENLTHPRIAFPKKPSLEFYTRAYKKKYDISIHLATLETLPDLVRQMNASLPKPSYVGFVVGADADELEGGHVAPLLCSFGREGLEFLIMDIFGGRDRSVKTLSHSLVTLTRRRNILTAIGDRQVDNFSCRTGALSLLRNALLSLRHNEFHEGLKAPIQRMLDGAEFDPDNVCLPSEWNYVEQIFHGNEERFAVRDYYSSKEAKRAHPRTVGMFRRQHTEDVRFRCILANMNNYQADFHALVPPPGTAADISEGEFKVTFSVSRPINTYLLHKGFRRAGLE